MNKQDLKALTHHWSEETNSLNMQIDEAFKQAQDHAYELGRQRGLAEGKEARDELLQFAEEVRRTGDTRLASMAIALTAKATGSEA